MTSDSPDPAALLDRTTDAILALDDDWRITYANETAREAIGVDDPVGRSFTDVFPQARNTRIEAAIDAAMTGDETVTAEDYLGDRDVWVEVRVFPADDGVLVYSRDISRRHAAVSTLETERRLFERVLDTSPVGIVVVDNDGTVVRANDRAQSLLELTESDVVGRPHDSESWLVPGDDEPVEATDLAIDRVIDTGQPVFDDVYGLRRDDDTIQWFSVNAMPLPGPNGVRVVATFDDITDHREYERRITEANERLALLNRLLRHDIRNDLQVILGWSDVLREQTCADEYVDRIENAGRAAVELTETARDLTDLVLSDANADRDLEPMALDAVLDGVLAKHRELYPEATFHAEEIPAVAVRADPLLGSLFGNVLSNAVQHNDREHPSVTVSVDVDADAVRVHVADDGPGIPDAVRDTLFCEPGRGLDSQGTGMGMYLVNQLVDDYDGDITAEPNDPRGTVFTVTLPRADADSE